MLGFVTSAVARLAFVAKPPSRRLAPSRVLQPVHNA
jgi:hypothetical protein